MSLMFSSSSVSSSGWNLVGTSAGAISSGANALLLSPPRMLHVFSMLSFANVSTLVSVDRSGAISVSDNSSRFSSFILII